MSIVLLGLLNLILDVTHAFAHIFVAPDVVPLQKYELSVKNITHRERDHKRVCL
jgi:hypothetical protein